MVTLEGDHLVFRFPDVHEEARLTVTFQRTLRIPDDDRLYPLPPGLGAFPLRHVDDYRRRLPKAWVERGGVLMPMHQAEAMWISFGSHYPVAIKVSHWQGERHHGIPADPGPPSRPTGLSRDTRPALAGRLLRREGRDSPVRGHAARARLFGGGADLAHGGARRAPVGRPSPEGGRLSKTRASASRHRASVCRRSRHCPTGSRYGPGPGGPYAPRGV